MTERDVEETYSSWRMADRGKAIRRKHETTLAFAPAPGSGRDLNDCNKDWPEPKEQTGPSPRRIAWGVVIEGYEVLEGVQGCIEVHEEVIQMCGGELCEVWRRGVRNLSTKEGLG
jgi:hypothetical protein